jgi:HPt (histidine-containing phosphotransfer) domain-containing protein
VLAADRPVLNRALALEAVQGSVQLLTELTLIFRDCASENLAEIERAVAAADAPQVRFHAHSLKGSASALAGERVAALARELEQLGASNDIGRATILVAALVTEIEALNLALTALCADSGAS